MALTCAYIYELFSKRISTGNAGIIVGNPEIYSSAKIKYINY
jgi:hypothetical protein